MGRSQDGIPVPLSEPMTTRPRRILTKLLSHLLLPLCRQTPPSPNGERVEQKRGSVSPRIWRSDFYHFFARENLFACGNVFVSSTQNSLVISKKWKPWRILSCFVLRKEFVICTDQTTLSALFSIFSTRWNFKPSEKWLFFYFDLHQAVFHGGLKSMWSSVMELPSGNNLPTIIINVFLSWILY